MNHTLPRFLIIGLLAGVSTAMAQSDLSYLFTSRPKNYFSAGINIRSGGPSVKFSHLGTLERGLFDPSSGENVYDDGMVGSDGMRANESSTTNPPRYNADKSRYQVLDPTTGLVVADEVSYQQGQTRIWSADNASQVHDGFVDMHFTTARETGARDGGLGGVGDGPGKSSGGFDIQLARDIGMIGKRASWGISFSLGMNDINAKTSQTVTADILQYTGRYTLNGTLPAADTQGSPYYSAPSPAAFSVGGTGVEDTVTLSAVALDTLKDASKNPIITTDNSAVFPNTTSYANTAQNSQVQLYPRQATVTGTWKIKGAYYLMRLGPSFRYYANKHFSFSANAGLAGAYVGSDFDIDESMVTPVISTLTTQPTFVGVDHKREFKVGAYVEANAEYWITFRTGFYAGALYDTLGKYKHEFEDAVANVDIGSGLSFRIGVITRF